MTEETGKTGKSEFTVKGEELVAKAKEIFHQGNVRRIIIKNNEGKEILRIPVNIGVLGVVIAPFWIALGAVATLLSTCTISIEK